MEKIHKKAIKKTGNILFSVFLNGLFALLPLAVTIGLITFVVKLITRWLEPLNEWITHYFGITFPYIEVIIVIIFIFLVGTILRIFLLRTIMRTLEKMFSSIPIVRPVYNGVKQLVHAFSFKDEASFKQVVAVQFPRKGMYSIGFITSELSHVIDLVKKDADALERYYNVFIPTTPNPTSGFFIIVAENELQILNITRQEAMAMIISGGIIQPKRHDEETLEDN